MTACFVFIITVLSAFLGATETYQEVGSAVVTLDPSGDGHVLRVTGVKEQFEVEFPWSEFGTFERVGEGELRYRVQETHGYPVHYLVAFLTGPALKSLEYPYLVDAPPMGSNKTKRMRDAVVQVILERLGGLATSGYAVVVSPPKVETPAEEEVLAHSYEYKAQLTSPKGDQTQMHFRIYLTREGVYLVAAVGEGIYRYRDDYPLPEKCRFFWIKGKEDWFLCLLSGPKSMMEPLSGKRLSSFWQRWVTNPLYRGSTNFVDRLYWGRYHPDYVFDSVELNVAE